MRLNSFQKGILALAVSQAIALPTNAATITVSSGADTSGADASRCTLRDAIISANTDAKVTSSGCVAGKNDDVIEFLSTANPAQSP